VRGFAWEVRIFARPWGFRLQDIRMPVYLWHGEEDVSTPVSMAHHVAGAIPNCHATFLRGEGYWLFLNHWQEILTQLTAGVGSLPIGH
jgi:pimeloyl-ACP methyl ester carboxylesterase